MRPRRKFMHDLVKIMSARLLISMANELWILLKFKSPQRWLPMIFETLTDDQKAMNTFQTYLDGTIKTAEEKLKILGKPHDSWKLLLPLDSVTGGIVVIFPTPWPGKTEKIFGKQ